MEDYGGDVIMTEGRVTDNMSEKKRFELYVNAHGQADIIDHVESKEKNAICIYNDLGVLPFSSAEAVCSKLNELSTENMQLKQQMKRVYNYFMDYLEEEMSSNSFSEMWDFVVSDEKM